MIEEKSMSEQRKIIHDDKESSMIHSMKNWN